MDKLIRTRYKCELRGLRSAVSSFSRPELWHGLIDDNPINIVDELDKLILSKKRREFFTKNKDYYNKI